MTKNTTIMLVAILAILIFSIYLVLPSTTSIFGHNVVTKLGLDLVGGQQILLEVDVPENITPDKAQLEKASQIVESRVNGLGVAEATVQIAGSRYINVELPGLKDTKDSVDTIKQTGVLEFVDMSNIPEDEAYSLIDKTIKTDLNQSSATPPTSPITATQTITDTVFHTVMTGSMLDSVETTTDRLGKPVVGFKLTSEGAKIFADFTRT
ncbi:MAG: hypothetical protein ACPL0B_03940, partial [Anaerolineales bacterium]